MNNFARYTPWNRQYSSRVITCDSISKLSKSDDESYVVDPAYDAKFQVFISTVTNWGATIIIPSLLYASTCSPEFKIAIKNMELPSISAISKILLSFIGFSLGMFALTGFGKTLPERLLPNENDFRWMVISKNLRILSETNQKLVIFYPQAHIEGIKWYLEERRIGFVDAVFKYLLKSKYFSEAFLAIRKY